MLAFRPSDVDLTGLLDVRAGRSSARVVSLVSEPRVNKREPERHHDHQDPENDIRHGVGGDGRAKSDLVQEEVKYGVQIMLAAASAPSCMFIYDSTPRRHPTSEQHLQVPAEPLEVSSTPTWRTCLSHHFSSSLYTALTQVRTEN